MEKGLRLVFACWLLAAVGPSTAKPAQDLCELGRTLGPNSGRARIDGPVHLPVAMSPFTLKCQLFVGPGGKLTIDPGVTVLCGQNFLRYGRRSASTALVVMPGGQIIANGTKDSPITFTAEQLGQSPAPTNQADTKWFARTYPKRLMAEVLAGLL